MAETTTNWRYAAWIDKSANAYRVFDRQIGVFVGPWYSKVDQAKNAAKKMNGQ